jgi:multimeric flavodoxin WrbA
MIALGIVGSHRRGGNSFKMVEAAMNEVLKADSSAETDIVELADMRIEPCRVCGACHHTDLQCAIEGDDFQMVYDRMKAADGLMIAAPLYFPIPSKTAAFMERAVSVQYAKMEADKSFVSPLTGKPAALFSTSGGSPVNLVLVHLLEFASFLQMDVVISGTWPGFGVAPLANWVDPVESAREMGRAFARKMAAHQRHI